MPGTCVKCGCTEDRACVTAMGACAWIDEQEDLCNRCARQLLLDPIEPATLAEAALEIRALRATAFETGRRLYSLESLLEQALRSLGETPLDFHTQESPSRIWTP